jgi:pyruvate,water dikinase
MVADRWITDWEPSPEFPLYTRANAGEVLPDPGSPLGWTLVWEPGVVMGWADSQISVGTFDPHELPSERPPVVGHFGGYLYINGSMARLFGVRGPGLTPEMIDLVYFGAHPDVPPYVAEPWHESPGNTAKLEEWMGTVLMAPDLSMLLDDQAAANAARASRPDLGAISDEELVERARSFVPLIRRLFEHHLTVTAGTSVGTGVLGAIAAAMGDPSIPLTLITGIGDVDSAAPSRVMWTLSRLDPDGPEFRAGLDDFLHEYGSRGPNEWDIRSDTWETKPSLAISLIDAMRKAPHDESPEVRNAHKVVEREQLTEQIRAALAGDPENLATFEAGLRSAHVYLAGRERAKTNIIKVIHEVRMAIRELGARHDYAPSQICMLLEDELDAFVADPSSFRARLAGREQQYLELFRIEPPFIINGAVRPLGEWAIRGDDVAPRAVVGDILQGVPGSPGQATGRARVILDPSDPTNLEPGDVLVAPITDPAWTPLFVPAAAVVVDVGAQVSHAVIVSRELGIPCAASVHRATERIPDGALVHVDGSTGAVTVLELPDAVTV